MLDVADAPPFMWALCVRRGTDMKNDEDDPEKVQDFIWHKQKNEVPSLEILNLAKLIRAKNLLSIDQLIISRNELHDIYNKEFNIYTSFQQFINILESLELVEVHGR